MNKPYSKETDRQALKELLSMALDFIEAGNPHGDRLWGVHAYLGEGMLRERRTDMDLHEALWDLVKECKEDADNPDPSIDYRHGKLNVGTKLNDILIRHNIPQPPRGECGWWKEGGPDNGNMGCCVPRFTKPRYGKVSSGAEVTLHAHQPGEPGVEEAAEGVQEEPEGGIPQGFPRGLVGVNKGTVNVFINCSVDGIDMETNSEGED